MSAATPQFNHARLPAWPSLDSSERYWAGYLGRKVDDMQLAREWYYGTATFLERAGLNQETTRLAWLLDSLLTALTHQETKIAYRALLQANLYRGQLQATAEPYSDAFRAAQARVEGLLFRPQKDACRDDNPPDCIR